MRTNLVLYVLHGLAIAFLLAMSSFSGYAPTNHQTPAEHPPMISHESQPASYVRGTIFVAGNGTRYASEGKAISSYSATGDKIFDFGETNFLVGGPSGDVFLSPNPDDRIRNIRHASAEGETLWHAPAPGLFAKAAVSSDGTLFYADTTGLYAFSPEGRVLWHHDLFDKIRVGLEEYTWRFVGIGPDSRLYVGNTKWVAFGPDGWPLWTLAPSQWSYGPPVFGPAGQIYVPSGNNLVSIDNTGQVSGGLYLQGIRIMACMGKA